LPAHEAKPKGPKGFRPVAETAGGVLDPMLRKRAGLVVDLLQSWDEIIGGDLAETSRPLRIAWPRRPQGDETFVPGNLVIACEGFAAMRIQHQTAEICDRVNAYCGFAAVSGVRIEQRPVGARRRPRKETPSLGAEAEARLGAITSGIEDEALREALLNLGRSIKAAKLRS